MSSFSRTSTGILIWPLDVVVVVILVLCLCAIAFIISCSSISKSRIEESRQPGAASHLPHRLCENYVGGKIIQAGKPKETAASYELRPPLDAGQSVWVPPVGSYYKKHAEA